MYIYLVHDRWKKSGHAYECRNDPVSGKHRFVSWMNCEAGGKQLPTFKTSLLIAVQESLWEGIVAQNTAEWKSRSFVQQWNWPLLYERVHIPSSRIRTRQNRSMNTGNIPEYSIIIRSTLMNAKYGLKGILINFEKKSENVFYSVCVVCTNKSFRFWTKANWSFYVETKQLSLTSLRAILNLKTLCNVLLTGATTRVCGYPARMNCAATLRTWWSFVYVD